MVYPTCSGCCDGSSRQQQQQACQRKARHMRYIGEKALFTKMMWTRTVPSTAFYSCVARSLACLQLR